MGKKRYYVVWNGLVPGVYGTWDECRKQIEGVKQALYKSFATRDEAERAYSESPHKYIYAKKEEKSSAAIPSTVCRNALAVDAACSGNPGQMEYRGVYLATGEEIFHFGPILGTNNIGEFLAIVHGLALLEKQQSNIPIYSDSRNALLWIKQKQCKTKLERNPATDEVFAMIERAEKWLRNHTYSNPLIKWETSSWGEIPADFGRK
ncbi:MAG: ribonuclease H family protein [Bacteroidaceae bacterium]|nr:ribonuclease H family protein [Bacteroidaceae bacterium]MBR5890500.1 ribonuclease H family protein [Bacteroidaceae bacterium]